MFLLWLRLRRRMGTWSFPYLKLLDLATYLVYVQRMAPAESSKLDSELAFVEGDTWPGIPSIQFIPPPSAPIQSARMSFRDSYTSTQTVEEISTPSDILVVNSQDWVLRIPPRQLSLQAGSYVWQLETVDTDGKVVSYMQGGIKVLPDIVPAGEKNYVYYKLLNAYAVCGSPSSTPIEVYVSATTTTPLTVGDFVYADEFLSVELSVPEFFLGVTKYEVALGQIISISLCGSSFMAPDSCESSSVIQLFSSSQSFPPLPGDTIFSDQYGTLFTGTFVAEGSIYSVVAGLIQGANICPLEQITASDSCDPIPLYFLLFTSPALVVGQEVKDAGMNPYSGTFVYAGVQYTCSSGVLLSSTPCPVLPPPTEYQVYSGCANATLLSIYTIQQDPTSLGSIIYANAQLNQYYYGWFSIAGQRYFADSQGVVIDAEPCTAFFVGSNYCYQGGQSLTLFATTGSSLTLGTALYTDEFLNYGFVNGYFVQNGYEYSTDSSGVIVSISPCQPVTINAYTYCPNFNPPPPSITLFANNYDTNPTNPVWQYIPLGTLICEDYAMTIPYVGLYGVGASFNSTGITYLTDSNGLVVAAYNNCY